jgi:uncharacterized protein YbaP (TraB family)
MTQLDDKELRKGLEQINQRIEATNYDDLTKEEKINQLQETLKSGDDIVYLLDQAINLLAELED